MLDVNEFSCNDKLVLNFFEILFKPERIPDIKFFEIINFRLLVAMLFGAMGVMERPTDLRVFWIS